MADSDVLPDEGYERAWEVLRELSEMSRDAKWVAAQMENPELAEDVQQIGFGVISLARALFHSQTGEWPSQGDIFLRLHREDGSQN